MASTGVAKIDMFVYSQALYTPLFLVWGNMVMLGLSMPQVQEESCSVALYLVSSSVFLYSQSFNRTKHKLVFI